MPPASDQAQLTAPATSSPCVACRLPLPIHPCPAADKVESWLCTRCGTKHHGVLLKNPPREIARNVKPADPWRAAATSPQEAHAPKGVARAALSGRGRVRCTAESKASQFLDNAAGSPANLVNQPLGPAFIHSVKTRGAVPYDLENVERFNEHYADSLSQVESLISSLEHGKALDIAAPETITREALLRATQDLDLSVRLGINPQEGDYPSRHSLHVAMLATAIGATLGWDEKSLLELGIGCLLHDAGMLRVPEDHYKSEQILDEGQFLEIVRHPLHTFDLLADSHSQVPLASRMVAFQIHERSNGTGYPRNRTSDMIHEAAQVAAVADVYVALVSPRPHRPALMPYYAVEHLLFEVKNGTLEGKAVRGLLKTVSLFPVGSYLALADGRAGRVIRANGNKFSRPIVEVWQPGEFDAPPLVIDLAQQAGLEVTGPLARLEPAQ